MLTESSVRPDLSYKCHLIPLFTDYVVKSSMSAHLDLGLHYMVARGGPVSRLFSVARSRPSSVTPVLSVQGHSVNSVLCRSVTSIECHTSLVCPGSLCQFCLCRHSVTYVQYHSATSVQSHSATTVQSLSHISMSDSPVNEMFEIRQCI